MVELDRLGGPERPGSGGSRDDLVAAAAMSGIRT